MYHGVGTEARGSFKREPLGCCSTWIQLHGGTGLGAWHDTSVTGSPRWLRSQRSLSYILRASAFLYKLNWKGLTFPTRASPAGPESPSATSHHVSLVSRAMTQPMGSTSFPMLGKSTPLFAFCVRALQACFPTFCFQEPFVMSGENKKHKHNPVCSGYFCLSPATSCQRLVNSKSSCLITGI